MRIMVVSDTHGKWSALYRAIMSQPQAEVIIHLGDGEDDLEKLRFEFPGKMMVNVAGNCDWGSSRSYFDTMKIEGKKIFFTHGHLHDVKWGLDKLIASASKEGADICLFGHTHIPYTQYRDGMYIMNPGSLGHPRDYAPSYGIIDIVQGGVVTSIVNLS
ncbi:MAG: metallophosphoesterase [Clostridia bacterium]|nr:metallophosphoesterase [Clostridia bacterium]